MGSLYSTRGKDNKYEGSLENLKERDNLGG